MPKFKTHSSSKKRFKITGTGKIKRFKAFANHIMTKKSTKRKRNLRKGAIADPSNQATIKKMMPYA